MGARRRIPSLRGRVRGTLEREREGVDRLDQIRCRSAFEHVDLLGLLYE